jgi:serine/threonine protein kinase
MAAAAQLTGLILDGGWTVVEQLKAQPSSGGVHSVPYIVNDADGKPHFLKAFDFTDAFKPGKDVVRLLRLMTEAYEHEREILELCKAKRLSRVVVAVTHGYVQVPGVSAVEGTVYYLIFELAESDVRRQVDLKNRLDTVWCLRILRDVTLGLDQLHRQGIAHQDPKPSNVLVYKDESSRIADFGRSSRKGAPVWIDDLKVAGDQTYAPPELLYGFRDPDFAKRRIGCDLYLLGNLTAFLFSGVNVTAGVFARLDPAFHPNNWGGTYADVLPYVRSAFEDTIIDLSAHIDDLVKKEVIDIIRQLCDPDLEKRGHPRGVGGFSQYSLERYVSHIHMVHQDKELAARRNKTP